MKRVSGLLLFLALSVILSSALAGVVINEAAFPDEGFRQYILDARFDENGDGYLSNAELRKVTYLDCHSRNIESLQGIENFTELTELVCYDNLLTEVDITKNKKLTSFSGYLNNLTELDLSQNKDLVSLSCSGNPVYELILPDSKDLLWMDISWTNLQQLEIGNYPLLVNLVREEAVTPYIYNTEAEDQVNWVSDTSFLAVNRNCILTANGNVLYNGSAEIATPYRETGPAPQGPQQ